MNSLINGIKHRIKLKAADLKFLSAPRRTDKLVLMYHGIDLTENRKFNGRFFSLKNFEAQLKYFKKNYNILSLENIMNDECLMKDKLNIAITFDDGYVNNFTYAYPLLEKYQTPAHFFITGFNASQAKTKILWGDLVDITEKFIKTDLSIWGKTFHNNNGYKALKEWIRKNPLGGTNQYNELVEVLNGLSNDILFQEEVFDYWKLVTDEQIKVIANSKFIKIGSHGFLHDNLASLPLNIACEDILKSKQYLENLTQYQIDSIGYPDGSYTKEIAKNAFDLGFKYQCAVNYISKECEKSIYIIDRLGLYPVITPNYLNYKINSGK